MHGDLQDAASVTWRSPDAAGVVSRYLPAPCSGVPLLLAALLAVPPGFAQDPPAPPSFRIAITIDDLPWAGPVPSYGQVEGNRRVLAALTAHHVPAVGFVNCKRVQPELKVLEAWLAAGQDLGNHQHSHDDLNKVPEEQWLAGVGYCDEALRQVLGHAPTYFRYPYLYNGPTPEIRDRVLGVLTGQYGYTIARVSVDNHEWRLATLYGEALKAGNTARAEEIGGDYVGHLTSAVRNFQEVAHRKPDHDVAHVLLLHDNALAADHLGDLPTALEGAGAIFIPLAEALADPVYAMPNAYEGRWGISWLYRIAPVDETRPWDDRTWAEIEERFGKE